MSEKQQIFQLKTCKIHSMKALHHLYHKKLKNGEIQPDELQSHAIDQLEKLIQKLAKTPAEGEKSGQIYRWNRSETINGLYMHGTVGRGKSMLMDLFFESLSTKRKRRVHFHAFMEELHERMHNLGFVDGDPVLQVASDIAEEAEVLCFDEFYISNIADAMMLGRFFQMLYACGVTTCATSNWDIEHLFKDGFNRQRFKPFIQILKENMGLLDLGAGTDWRTKNADTQNPLPHVIEKNLEEFKTLFKAYAQDTPQKNRTITISGSKITAIEKTKSSVHVSFNSVCNSALGPEQYISLVEKFGNIFISDIPKLTAEQADAAMRFVVLVDIAYENDTKLFLNVDVPLKNICDEGDSAFAFKRTISRIYEMQKW